MYCKFDLFLIISTFTKRISIKDISLVMEVFDFKTFLRGKRQDYRISMMTSFLQWRKKFNLILIIFACK